MITVNGVDLSVIGFLARSRSFPALPAEQTSTLTIPGGFPIRTGGAFSPGTLAVAGTLSGADHTSLLASRDTLAALVDGECVIRFSDLPDREWVGWLQGGARFAMIDPQWLQRAAELSLDFLCPDPRARAQAETTRVGSGALVLGGAPTPIRVELTGAAATIRVRAGGASGDVVTELVWSGSSGAVVVDGDTQSVSVGGVNAIAGITPASTFPVGDPLEGADYIEVPAGATVRYLRRWW